MKKTFKAFLIVSIFISSISLQTAVAQNWNTAGNSTATTSSILGTTVNVPLKFYTNSKQRMVIDSLGGVGINTFNPVNLLSIRLNGSDPAASWLGGSAPAFFAFGEETTTGFNLATAANAAGYRPVLNTRRSRGTLASPKAVSNNDYLTSFVSSGYDGSAFQNPASIDFYVDGLPSSGHVPGRISFVTGTNNGDRLERLKIGSTGDVGITSGNLVMGSAAKTIQFATPIVNSAPMMTMFPSGTQNVDRMVISHSPFYTNWGLQYQDGSDKFNFLSNGTPVLTADLGTQRVGIGTSSPGYLLDVAGRMRIRTSNGSAGAWFMNAANTTDVAFTGMANDNSVGFYGNTGAGWGIIMNTTSGNIGMGTFTPAYKLDVCGTIRAKEMRVETGWCDYVFDKDYKLKSFDELEKFISDNKHLPGIAPASEVETQGLKVGEMNKAMMEKIEELTLYVIQLGKENKKLQDEIDSLKK